MRDLYSPVYVYLSPVDCHWHLVPPASMMTAWLELFGHRGDHKGIFPVFNGFCNI